MKLTHYLSCLKPRQNGIDFAILRHARQLSFDYKTRGKFMTGQLSTPLRQQAMDTLKESTVMLKVACNLIEQGNRTEAQRLQNAARAKREVSMMLMAKATALENGIPEGFSAPFDSQSETEN